MKINHQEFLTKFGMVSGGCYWGGDLTVNCVNHLWSEYCKVSEDNDKEYLKMVDVFAKNLGKPKQIKYER